MHSVDNFTNGAYGDNYIYVNAEKSQMNNYKINFYGGGYFIY